MVIEKIICGEWYKKSDWQSLKAGTEDSSGEPAYTKADFENFAELSFREAAEKIGVKYSLIKDVLYGRNVEFFQLLAEVFSEGDTITEDEAEYTWLTSKLWLPYEVAQVSSADTFLGCFEGLSLEDKIEVLNRFSNVEILVEIANPTSSAKSVLNHFSELSYKEKCEVLRQFLGATIKI